MQACESCTAESRGDGQEMKKRPLLLDAGPAAKLRAAGLSEAEATNKVPKLLSEATSPSPTFCFLRRTSAGSAPRHGLQGRALFYL